MDSPRKLNNPAVPGKPSPPLSHNANQGVATLIVMIAVLVIIVLFCCFAAPGIRGLCKRYIFRTCDIDDPDIDNASRITEEASPTVILLPNGRMVVVDRRVWSHPGDSRLPFQGSTPSILDSSETSKGVSPTSLGYPPPHYEDVFPHLLDLPPSYSEISLLAKKMTASDSNCEAVAVTASGGSCEAVNVAASGGGCAAVNVSASGGGCAAVNVSASGGGCAAVNVSASGGGCEAVSGVGFQAASEAVGVAAADEGFEAIEMVGLERRRGMDLGGECANSEQNTVVLVENNVNRTNHDF